MRRVTLLPRTCCTISILLAFGESLARAQSGDADERFREGIALLEAGKTTAACEKLAESYRLTPKLGTLQNLAICHELDGKPASAHREFTELGAQATAQRRPERAEIGRRRAEALAPRLHWLVIRRDPSAEPTTVSIDGREIRLTGAETRIPIDPGKHEISADVHGETFWASSVVFAPGPATSVLPMPRPSPTPSGTPATCSDSQAASAPTSLAATSSMPPSKGADPRRLVGWGAVASGAGAIALAGYFALTTSRLERESRDEASRTPSNTQEVNRLYDDAQTSQAMAIGAGSIGLAAAGFGLFLLLAPREARTTVKASPHQLFFAMTF